MHITLDEMPLIIDKNEMTEEEAIGEERVKRVFQPNHYQYKKTGTFRCPFSVANDTD
jgi:hypothetical protein